MNFLKNNFGISLVESLVAMGLTAAAGVAYMSHMKNVAKNDADQKIRASLDNLAFEATTYLQSRDICTANFAEAFGGEVIPASGSVSSQSGYASLMGKPVKDASGGIFQSVIFEPKKSFDASRIYVDKVKYDLNEISTVAIASSPWNRSSKLAITVEFVTCRNGNVSVPIPGTELSDLVCPPELQKRVTKRIERYAAFRVGSDNKIEKKNDKLRLACADSQDALVEEAQKYTDLRACVLEMKLMLVAGQTGELRCGIKVSANDKNSKHTNSGVINFPTKGVMPNSMTAKLVGGGGGGGSGSCSFPCTGKGDSGGGGGAGEVVDVLVTGANNSCSIQIGDGGAGAGYGKRSSKPGGAGGETKLTCGSVVWTAKGGGGGGGGANDQTRCGTPGAKANYVESVGGNGTCKESGPGGTAGKYGGGGGGGSSQGGWGKERPAGLPGGKGVVALTWKEYSIEDPDDVLSQLGDNISNYVAN